MSCVHKSRWGFESSRELPKWEVLGSYGKFFFKLSYLLENIEGAAGDFLFCFQTS